MYTMSPTVLAQYLKAGNPKNVAPLTAKISTLAEMFDINTRNVRECIRDNAILPLMVGNSGKRYCVLEVWDAVNKTRGKEFPVVGGNKKPAVVRD